MSKRCNWNCTVLVLDLVGGDNNWHYCFGYFISFDLSMVCPFDIDNTDGSVVIVNN